ncbi:putative ferulic acid Esterase/Feruloyl esterase [Talaromyces proteolyticus]|uniref:Carboxylic ester hydrolase n=1 Tax=Talaromyces proteolyticus TaxID=1131652 RepID=A0AAD4KDB7_9EURO|nr:putative ferulic acid Esterase/Feruloyl esterase [Talaromyces proteolyticus]KAH8688805.1 putative ferulic acid Esterase/Feruloyl esterase [Talaromyces proteolyticus]
MLSLYYFLVLIGGVVPLVAAHYPDHEIDFPRHCVNFGASLNLPNVTVNFAEHVPAGTNLTFSQDYGLDTCQRPYQVVYTNTCRIAMNVTTSNRSSLILEAWFPKNWTGRFLSTGNGGQSGCIQYEDMAYAGGLGFASVGANNGHNGTGGLAFFHNPDVVIDFSWRSMHTGVVLGKEMTKLFYGRPYTKSYYLGCSTGGRQGLYAAQEFPNDFDGILAGSPAIDRNALVAWNGHFFGITGNSTSNTFVSAAKWATVHTEILRQCDGLDGVLDGIIEDPTLCYPRPEALQCAPGMNTSSTCLTSDQVLTVRAVLSDYIGEDRQLIFPRLQPGAELGASKSVLGAALIFIKDWYKYVVYQNASWDPASFNIKDATYSIALNPANIATFKGNLSAFQSAGGKVMVYHGQQDDVITSPNTARYYNHVSNVMGLPSKDLDPFFRFFRVSGMGHCSKGPGAWQIGQTYIGAQGNAVDSQHNVLMRLVDWVENGDRGAPETITGVKYVNVNYPGTDTIALGVDFVRNHCRYPLRNICVDASAHRDPRSWRCE